MKIGDTPVSVAWEGSGHHQDGAHGGGTGRQLLRPGGGPRHLLSRPREGPGRLPKNVYLQIHFGANYTAGEYGWATDLEAIKRSIGWQLENLQTDYIDFGFIHCLDERTDVEAYEKSGALQYLLDMKAQGVVRHIGLSSHNPDTVQRVLDKGIVDMLMFSINPMYD